MKSFEKLLTQAMNTVIVVALALMVIMVFGNVVLRYVFNSGITISEELSRWLFVWMTFLGAIVALKDNGHLGTDMLVSRFGPLGRRLCMALAQVAMLAITALVFKGAWAQVQINLEVEAPVSGLSVGWFYLAGVVFAVSSLPILLLQLWRNLRPAATA